MQRAGCGVLLFLTIGIRAMAAPTGDGLYATWQTTHGDIVIELAFSNAPAACANFVGLMEGSRPWIDPRSGRVVSNRYYDGLTFHRVVSNFVIQTGSVRGNPSDNPGYVFPDQFDPSLRHDASGVVAMANSGPDSNGGQGYITLAATPGLDDAYTVFGRVVEGMSNVMAIGAVPTDADDRPLTDVVITNTLVTRNGPDAEAFAVTHPDLPDVTARTIDLNRQDGPRLVVDLPDLTEGFLYRGDTLEAWTSRLSTYALTGDTWSVSVPTQEVAFFHGASVTYAMDTNLPTSPAGWTWSLTFPASTYTVAMSSATSGTLSVTGAPPDALTFISWERNPLEAVLLVGTASTFPYRFDLYATSPTNGRCRGFVILGPRLFPLSGGAVGQWTAVAPP
jgi:cyclophilin family peptidyl-prolyl cis-trans isomerase